MIALIIFSIIVRISIKNFKELPYGFQNVIESLVETFDIFVQSAAGNKVHNLGNWYFMIFSFIFIANIIGIVGLKSPTADWSMTFACALITFVTIQIVGVKHRKGAYLKSFFEPHFLFFPLNIIGELSRPISLSFRLFGNVLTGTIIISLIYTVAPVILRFLLPAALNIYFDLITGALQTYIFCILSLSFIGAASVGDNDDNAEITLE
jgi:F-type H+-transporting ATPase subunit a